MARQELNARRRSVLGKKVAQLRRDGLVPGIVYGPVVSDTVPVSVDRREFIKFFQAHGHSTLFDLRWENGEQAVFIREVQNDPVRREPLHVDFYAPNLRLPTRAHVPLVFHNPVVTSAGVLTEVRTGVEVEALPDQIPHQIDVDVSGLETPGDVIRVSDLTLPGNVVAITDGNDVVVQMEAVYQEPEAAAEPESAEARVEEGAAEALAETPEG